jgi:hypothetical protein
MGHANERMTNIRTNRQTPMEENMTSTTQPPQSSHTPAPSWREAALARSEIITDAWEVTKTYAGRIAEWVLFLCMVMNIIEILVTLPLALSNIVLGTQVVMLDVGGFSLASMGDHAREQGDARAARRASVTGYFLIAVTIVTLLLVTVGLLWSPAKSYTDGAEKGLILVRVVMTVIYAHVIHSLRRATTQRQQATLTEQFTELTERITESEQRITEQCNELIQRTANRLSVQFTEHLKRTVSEHSAFTEHANITETLEAHARTLTELAALPTLLEQLQQEVQSVREAQTEHQHRTAGTNSARPKLSVVEANTEYRTPNTSPKQRTGRANTAESDKGAFVRFCLTDTPNIRNSDIQRKASEQGLTISPAYISEIRKAFTREQSA